MGLLGAVREPSEASLGTSQEGDIGWLSAGRGSLVSQAEDGTLRDGKPVVDFSRRQSSMSFWGRRLRPRSGDYMGGRGGTQEWTQEFQFGGDGMVFVAGQHGSPKTSGGPGTDA